MASKMLNETVSHLPPLAHPYYPVEIEVVGYLANRYSTPVLLLTFLAGVLVVSAVTLTVVNRNNARLPALEKAALIWFVISMSPSPRVQRSMRLTDFSAAGTIHLFFEGRLY